MANVIKKATNRFTKGLVMDFSPENTKNEVLTHALNATLLTFNGNEMSLQNDMGNARVETAYLPEGYMPVGTCEYGGIIYIVSYNPLEDKSQVGCFPSPERNISSDEIGRPNVHISKEDFQEIDKETKQLTGVLKHNTQYVLLKNDNLNPGDKFLICSNHEIYNEKLENLLVKKDPKYNSNSVKDEDVYELVPHPMLALNVVSIEESGKIVYLNSDIRRYEVANDYEITKEVNGESQTEQYKDIYKYHILGTGGKDGNQFNQQAIDIDSYRNTLSSGYSVFKSKTSGKLAILAELIMIDSYSVTHSLKPCVDEQGKTIDGKFDVILHHEVSPNITNENYNIAPKLRYYYLQKSQGYIQYCDSDNSIQTRTLFKENNGNILQTVNNAFLNTPMSSIYEQEDSINSNKTLQNECQFNFPYTDTYHGKMVSYNNDTDSINKSVYTKLTEGKYHRFNKKQIEDNIDYFYKNFKFYKYVDGEVGYTQVTENHTISKDYTYYVKIPNYRYVDAKRDENYINETLYKLTTSAQVATKTEIENKLVEKFQYEEIHTYELATQEDISSGKELWYTNDDPNDIKFISLTGSPVPGVQYYVRKVERNLVSIGFDVDSETIKGAVYYYPTTKNYEQATDEDREKYFDFVTYPYDDTKASYGCPITLYYQETDYYYKPATQEQIENYESLGIVLFYDSNYIQISDIKNYVENNQLFIVASVDTYLTYDQFKPNVAYNYIAETDTKKIYDKDDPLYLFTLSNFIPTVPTDSKSDNYTPYQDLKLGTIQLPSLVYTYGVDLPFKYDYTIVPCMNYGRLDHLAVSNTVDFSKLHAFNRSGFTTWKYRIDDGYLRLTVGAEIFDTYETYKVDGLIFEFYDHRGFAGSLEFVDKKSYNGVFTKVIPLNSLQALSRKRIFLDGKQTTDYKHNINIIEEYADGKYQGRYYLNNEEVEQSNYQQGWKYVDNPDVPIDNDCGTIYSNVIYGIKAYLRRTTDQGVEYIRKPDLFVYTLPIFNEYYYKIDNFMSINNPKLQFMLTYKLTDESTKVPYNSDTISQGYNSSDKNQINKYISGVYNTSQNTKLDLVKYYKYSGTTNLYLEVGLKQDYNNVNLAYNPELNKYFTCELELISDNDEKSTYNVVSESSELTDPTKILNYYQNDLSLNINKLVFAHTDDSDLPVESSELSIKSGELLSKNFIHNQGNDPIKITYDFIVGYTVNISNIRTTNVPATTVCALFHKTQDDEYNYKDFGIYTQDRMNDDPLYLSDVMFYNGGTSEQEEFGLCRQRKVAGDDMLDECHIYATELTDAKVRVNYGDLNSGEPLKKMVPYLGKLTFCQPHAHGMSLENGVNIHETKQEDGSHLYGIPPGPEVKYATHGESNDYEHGYGIVPRDFLHYNPKYNLSLNTKDSILRQSVFISTLESKVIKGRVLGINMKNTHERKWNENMPMREYTGFTGTQIELFNRKLLKTMSKVYAYNPDYDSLQVNLGDVTLQKYSPKFTSNIISKNSAFIFVDNNTLNDYIYISNINLTQYLIDLNKFSLDTENNDITVKKDKQFINHLQFTADYTYCGTDIAPYLINQLTYNTVVPSEIEEELTFNKSNLVVVKHTDNTNSFISGNLNKNLLYGYNTEYKKLITLDVSNYQIDIDGNLIMDSSGTKKEKDLNCIITPNISNSLYPPSGAYSYYITPDWGDGLSETINVTLSLNKTGVQNLINFVEDTGEFFVTNTPTQDAMTNLTKLCLFPNIQIKNNKKYYYDVYIDSIKLQCAIKVLNQDILTRNNISLSQQSEETLKQLVFGSKDAYITYQTLSGPVGLQNKQVWMYPDAKNEIYIQNFYKSFTGNYYDATLEHNIQLNNAGINIYSSEMIFQQNYLALYYFNIKQINYKLTRMNKLDSDPNDIIINNKTTDYSSFENETYAVYPKYNQTRLRGTSITLNDLVYDPAISGHRLFMRNNCARYNTSYRCKLYYRYLDNKTWTTDIADWKGNLDSSWKYSDTKDLNTLFIMNGPSFTENNLESDPSIV